jgi:hypothetical protein
VLNPSAFTAGLDLSFIAVQTRYNGTDEFPAMLVNSRFILCAAHVAGFKQLVFKAPGGAYASANIISGTTIDYPRTDIFLGYLDAPITAIAPAKFLPADWASYLPTVLATDLVEMNLSAVPAGTHPSFLPLIAKTFTPGSDRPWGDGYSIVGAGSDPTASPPSAFAGWSIKQAIGGDSSGPLLALVDGAPVLVSAWHTPTGGPWYASSLAAIASAMASLASARGDGNAYAIATVDLSGFSTF